MNEKDSIKSSIHEVEVKLEKVAEDLEVKLPKGTLPFAIRIITLIMIIGGLSILGSVFTDFSVPRNGGVIINFYRFITGVLFLVVAYGLEVRQRWSLWLYAIVVFIGLILNFSIALIPALLVIYLYTKRALFKPCFLDIISDKLLNKLKARYKSTFQ